MPEELNVLNFEDAIKELDSFSSDESLLTEIWIPSLKRKIKLKELTAKQQRKIVESAVDTTEMKSTFSSIFFEILNENCLESSEIISNLTIFDKASIFFGIRSQISNTLTVFFENNNNKIEANVDVFSITEKLLNYIHPKEEEINIFKSNSHIKILISVPTIKEEVELDKFIFSKNNKEKSQYDEVKKLLGNIFLTETIKYIKELHINGKDYSYKNLKLSQKIEILEKLPASVTQGILNKASEYKKELESYYTVIVDDTKKVIDVDASLFLSN